jgi:hypothetical protein
VPVTTLPPGLTVGQVRVVVEADRYGSCDTIPVWAGNGLDHSISGTDHQSDCTIVTLQHRVADTWETLARCLLATPTRVVVLPSMHANFIPLAPGGSGTQQGGAWPAGTYRVAFSYYEGSEPSPGTAKVVYSPTFTIA